MQILFKTLRHPQSQDLNQYINLNFKFPFFSSEVAHHAFQELQGKSQFGKPMNLELVKGNLTFRKLSVFQILLILYNHE